MPDEVWSAFQAICHQFASGANFRLVYYPWRDDPIVEALENDEWNLALRISGKFVVSTEARFTPIAKVWNEYVSGIR